MPKKDNYDYVESAIIFGLDSKANLNDFRYVEKDFATHGSAYSYVVKFWEKYGEFPSPEHLSKEFPLLAKEAQSVNFDYAKEEFKSHVLQRKVIKAVKNEMDLVYQNPKRALSNIMINLTDIEVVYDEDVQSYDSGDLDRLNEWKQRTKTREMGEGMMGIPTSFKTINDTGVGWMKGELIAMFARPTVGKTWMCVHAAATAVNKGFRTLLISTEMPTRAINMRTDVVLGNMMGYKLSHSAIRRGDKIDELEYTKFLQNANNKSLLVCDHIAGQMGISTQAIASLVRKHKPDFVVIDGVYLVSTGDRRQAVWEQSHALFYGLKNLATATDTPIMVSTQATREASNMFIPPRADQVAFGDALIRAADVAMAMCALENDDKKRLVQFQKYRDGVLAKESTVMDWDLDCGAIKELPDYDWMQMSV